MANNVMNYIINLEEMAEALRNAMNKSIQTTTGKEKVQSAKIYSNNATMIDIPTTAVLTGVVFRLSPHIAQNHFVEFDLLVWDVNGPSQITQTVPMMEATQTVIFDHTFEIGQYTRVTSRMIKGNEHYPEEAVGVVDVCYYEFQPLKEIFIACKDKETGETIYQTSQFHFAPATVEIKSPEPWGYQPIRSSMTVELKLNSPPIHTVTFEYERIVEGKVVIVQHKSTKNTILREEEFIILPPDYGEYTYNAVELPWTWLLTQPTVTLNITNDSPPTSFVFFYYKELQ